MTFDIQGVTSNSGWIVTGPVGYQTFTGGTFILSDGSGVLLQGTIGNSALSAPAGSDPQVATIFSFNAINYSTISANLNTGLSAPLPGSYSISMQFIGSYSTPTSNVPGGLSAFNTTGTGTFNAVPVPPAVWLFGTGLLGLVAVARRRKTD